MNVNTGSLCSSVARSRYYENIARSKKIMSDSEFTKS